ncbi:class I SAM-dependent methyltransferase [Flavobacteriaceae bacterium]|nr:class I SAM-dependent methyltransferase [Flavobacteriaceae bacterium]
MIGGSKSYDNIDEKNYKIPFDANHFDVDISDQTIEHVKNLDQFISESYRVLKNNGVFCSYFPSKYKIIEPHVGIPFRGIFNSKFYIKCCCFFGLVKSKYKYIYSYNDIHKYLKKNTFYRDEHVIKKLFKQKFKDVKFKSDDLLLAFIDNKDSFKAISSRLMLNTPFGRIF